ncbi:MAG: class II fumarate hydratase [Bdellovibrionales bacterium]|nr:class II fumarate hydratase [Bdellovibrionales bacterium]
MSKEVRIEKDSMGTMEVPVNAYYGAQTQRAFLNFPISRHKMPKMMIHALGEIKRACAVVSGKHGWVDATIANAIVKAAEEVSEGKWDEQFVVDIYQTGSGTSSNMNTNEVIANRACEILGKAIGSKHVHPNDHVNYGQSSNDVFPTAMHLAILQDFQVKLLPALSSLQASLIKKAKAFDDIVKIGRTHLQDATPIRMGQVFSGFAYQIQQSIERIQYACTSLEELALGGTAVGTGINRPSSMTKEVIAEIASRMDLNVRETPNHFSAQGSKDAVVHASSSLKELATTLMKLANDIRFLSSGPRCGIGELILPETQPGSSIMPGKVNPVIAESLMMICAQVIGYDVTVSVCNQAGNFELNVMMPAMLYSVLESSHILQTGISNFEKRCVQGIEVDQKRCEELIELSMSMVTSLAPLIGYDKAAEIAKESHKTGKTVRELCIEKNVLPADQLKKVLDPRSMTEPNKE